MWLGNFSYCSRTINNSQFIGQDSGRCFAVGLGCSPDLMKVMTFLEGWEGLLHPWSCLRRYRPSPRAFKQLLRMCSRVLCSEQSGHAGESSLPHKCKFDGLRSTSAHLPGPGLPPHSFHHFQTIPSLSWCQFVPQFCIPGQLLIFACQVT